LILGFIVFLFILGIFLVVRPFLEREMIIAALAKNGITAANFPIDYL
jgi:hypothetical protein